jgi:hypothetical protein
LPIENLRLVRGPTRRTGVAETLRIAAIAPRSAERSTRNFFAPPTRIARRPTEGEPCSTVR